MDQLGRNADWSNGFTSEQTFNDSLIHYDFLKLLLKTLGQDIEVFSFLTEVFYRIDIFVAYSNVILVFLKLC